MKLKILKTLKSHKDEYISGEELSHKLGVTRTAVWKNINTLRKEGYIIDSSSRKGYKLVSTPGIFSAEEIQMDLPTEILGNKIVYKDTVTSTNTIAKDMAVKGEPEGTVIIGNHQTAGKGRLGRTWVSPSGTGIWMSVILRPDIVPTQAPFITILAALAVARSIEQVAEIKPGIKWPNDIVLNKKKVCGILTEMSAEIERVNHIVVGIGINVNIDAEQYPEKLRNSATSIKIVTGKKIDRKQLVQRILENFEAIYIQSQTERESLLEQYRNYSLTLDHQVKVIWQNRETEGKAIEITEDGELLVETNNGKVIKVFSGEVSVRGLYGYV